MMQSLLRHMYMTNSKHGPIHAHPNLFILPSPQPPLESPSQTLDVHVQQTIQTQANKPIPLTPHPHSSPPSHSPPSSAAPSPRPPTDTPSRPHATAHTRPAFAHREHLA
ncbi:predicted protein [Plenodomus lingam JN3]|uniref:Predicted protein n=1 Tax=Leptosphaeria maculans (strain JN3 / isolate v23.1.3 / race Av1-4-5-6-7-8) TaxID=985895 RepID=E5A1J3_LEPMJ|nr:predicted protein [Plenodomus lingam JN3]CBX97457.1 predicted protein [Plenodomus lingam JN3]